MDFDKFEDSVKAGQRGDNIWIPLGPAKLGKHVGIGKHLYHLIGGDPGTGKTAFVDQMYVLNTYEWMLKNAAKKDIRLKIIYSSMERSSVLKIAKWVCWKLWTDHRIIIDVPTILRWGDDKRKLSDYELNLIKGYRDYFEKMLNTTVDLHEGRDNPTGVYKLVKDFMLQNGTDYRRTGKGILQKIDYNKWKQHPNNPGKFWVVPRDQDECDVKLYDRKYVPDDDRLLVGHILDHTGKPSLEQGFGKKQNMDKMSEYQTIMRDHYGTWNVAINQFNRNNSDIQRRINTDLSPEEQDFKGSGNMYEDADMVLGLFNPRKFGLRRHLNYNMNKCTNEEGYNRFRSLHLLKNTYGISDVAFGYRFIGECGNFLELPKASKLEDKHYRQIRNPKRKNVTNEQDNRTSNGAGSGSDRES